MSTMSSTTSEKTTNDQLKPSLEQRIDGNNLLHVIILKCKEEMENNCLKIPLHDYVERVAHYTDLSESIIKEAASKNLKEIDHKNKYFSLMERKNIFAHVAGKYLHQEIPTFENIYEWYKKVNTTTLTFSQFQYMMSCLGFEYSKTESGRLIENPTLTFERYLYLKQINNFRLKCAPVYYIDEIFLDSTFTLQKPSITDINISSPACDGYVFFHAISKQGFFNGLYCSPTNKIDFIKWISHIIIPKLPGPSVIVMDNNELHGSFVNDITKYHSKNDMLQYLRKNNIPCNNTLHKAELFELINKCCIKQQCYDVDEIFRAHGHHVLRLPANFHDLSMTYFLWKYFLQYESSFFLSTDLAQIKVSMLEKLHCLPQQLWDNFHVTLLATEQDILDIDSKIDIALETNSKVN